MSEQVKTIAVKRKRYSVSRKKTDVRTTVSLSVQSYLLLKREAQKRGKGQFFDILNDAVEKALREPAFVYFMRSFSMIRDRDKTIKLISLKQKNFEQLKRFAEEHKHSISEIVDAAILFSLSQPPEK